MIPTFRLGDHPDTAARFARALQLEDELDDMVRHIAHTAGLEPCQVHAQLIAARSEARADKYVQNGRAQATWGAA